MELFDKITRSINDHPAENAFCINDRYYRYADLASVVSGIRDFIRNNVSLEEKQVGLIANDDLETYAAILALWFEGKAYVPLNPAVPAERNLFIVKESGIQTVLNSLRDAGFPHPFINISALKGEPSISPPRECDPESLAYIMFTSGTTGIPKGVPISAKNLESFSKSFREVFPGLREGDRWLQMFDLTFDLSVMSFLIPLLHGACIYTIPPGKIRFNYIVKLLDNYKLTGALLIPSVINYLRPYFPEIRWTSMKFCLFCGEALSLDLTREWSDCIPNAEIWNVYGPTENTIFCTYYKFNRHNPQGNKSANGILSIGRCMPATGAVIANKNDELVDDGETGELCLSGDQLTSGYWNNNEKSLISFFYKEYNGKTVRFYRTGDLCSMDADGDIMYKGRTDTQVKIQGYRVELSEIEFVARQYLNNKNVLAVSFQNAAGIMEIGLVIESGSFNYNELIAVLKQKLPSYMIPAKIIFQESFPSNANGKTDHKQLKQLFAPDERSAQL